MPTYGWRLFLRKLRTFLRNETMHGGGFIAKHSSFLICEGCFLKAFGLLPRIFRDALGPPILVGVATVGCRMPGCHGEGIELPTSLPASDAVKKNKKKLIEII